MYTLKFLALVKNFFKNFSLPTVNFNAHSLCKHAFIYSFFYFLFYEMYRTISGSFRSPAQKILSLKKLLQSLLRTSIEAIYEQLKIFLESQPNFLAVNKLLLCLLRTLVRLYAFFVNTQTKLFSNLLSGNIFFGFIEFLCTLRLSYEASYALTIYFWF